jgi:four helix bundle protein
MDLSELKIYNISIEVAEEIWQIVMLWDNFAKDTIGKQIVRSADSIAANISEGYGRYHFKESKHFLYYSRGSLYETRTWLTKSYRRKLINQEIYDKLVKEIKDLSVKLNNYIKSIGKSNS